MGRQLDQLYRYFGHWRLGMISDIEADKKEPYR
jgi:hypothetical protein